MRNLKATIEYDGSRYSGFQLQCNQPQPTIQGEIEKAMESLFNKPIKIYGAGRTDSGVHAEGQVFNFHIDTPMTLEKMPLAINHKLPDDIVVTKVEEVDELFHARKSATGKYYVYKVYNRRQPTPFGSGYVYWVPYRLDEDKIREGCKLFEGKHNFEGFCSKGSSVKTYERTIHELKLIRNGDLWEFHFYGDGFLYNMVRIIVGTLLQLGSGRRDLDTIKRALEERDRSLAGPTASPQGLCLKKVYYS